MPQLYRLLIIAIAAGLFIPLGLERGFAQATPTADEVCAPYLEDAEDGTPVAESGTPVDVDPASLEFDLLFLDAMIPHHEMAILMAQVARDRGERPELKAFANTISSAQQAEVDLMRGWRESWYPDVPVLTSDQLIAGMNAKLAESPGVGGVAGLEEMGVDHMAEELAELCGAADDFDLVFIDVMLAHHSSAIVLGQEAANRTERRETRDLATTIVVTQQYEVDQMLTWRELWYPGAPIEDHDH